MDGIVYNQVMFGKVGVDEFLSQPSASKNLKKFVNRYLFVD